ncbi:hypothetical protein GCM10009757_04260 [Streptomyces cheonanensis]|uniref:Uncharacterized protein n=1 Tax=Streptomyces cheonanensis TaxID=312720 RepID=A0ABP5GAW1_9ACTN
MAHDTSGQSDSTEQASNARVIESPIAATDAGLVFHTGAAGAPPSSVALADPGSEPSGVDVHPASSASEAVAASIEASTGRLTGIQFPALGSWCAGTGAEPGATAAR